MGQSTNGEISFSIAFPEEFEFPWDAKEHDGDIVEWWRCVNGFKHSFEVFNSEGNCLIPKASEERIDRYFAEEHEWDAAHPLPVTLVNACSADYPRYLLAIPKSCMTARRGYPEEIDFDALRKTETAEVLIDFCEKYKIDRDGEEPKWHLSSYWG